MPVYLLRNPTPARKAEMMWKFPGRRGDTITFVDPEENLPQVTSGERKAIVAALYRAAALCAEANDKWRVWTPETGMIKTTDWENRGPVIRTYRELDRIYGFTKSCRSPALALAQCAEVYADELPEEI